MAYVTIGRHKGIFVTGTGEVKMDQWGENSGETRFFPREKKQPFRSSIVKHVHPPEGQGCPEPYTSLLSSG